MIAIIDYGAGNLTSVQKAMGRLGHECVITKECDVVACAERLIIPGVGNFKATQPLANGLLGVAVRDAIKSNKPVLGVCLGLQWMFEGSEEAPEMAGLGAFRGTCRRFSGEVKSPHVGWNRVDIEPGSRLLRGVPSGSYVYFTHSYRAPLAEGVIATTRYDGEFAAAVERDSLFGVQFHPEKSGDVGLKILENFCAL